jgi:hypothetical protein
MASVHAPHAVQHPGAPMPAGATKQQAEEVFRVCSHYGLFLFFTLSLLRTIMLIRHIETSADEGARRATVGP